MKYKGFKIQKQYCIIFPNGTAYDYCNSVLEAKEIICSYVKECEQKK